MTWRIPHPRWYHADSSRIGSLMLMTLHWCITCSSMLTGTWWSIKVVLMGNIWKDILTKWRLARTEVDVIWVLYQQKVTTVFNLHWHIYVEHVWPCVACLHTAVEYTCINKTKSSKCLHRDARCVCVYVCLCVSGVEQWPLLAGRGASHTESQWFRRADVLHSSNSHCRGHRERLTHCGWGMAEQGMQPHAPLCTPSHHTPTHSFLMLVCVRVCLTLTASLRMTALLLNECFQKNLIVHCETKIQYISLSLC